MNFDFSDDQKLLRDQLRRFLQRESPLRAARAVLDGQGTHGTAVWRGLVDLGATTLMLPEDCGGADMGAMELCVLAEEAGRQLAAVPLASTLYLATQVMLLGASAPQRRRWLAPVAAGAVGAFAAPLDGVVDIGTLPRFDGTHLHGQVPLVADGEAANWGVVLAHDGRQPTWVVTDLTSSVQRRRLATLDPSKPFASWCFDATPAEALDLAPDARHLLARVRRRAAVLLAFEQLGAADAALEAASAYARERRAFGRAIGSYQGIKHKLVDLSIAIEAARVHAWYGAWALAADAATPAGVPELAAAAAAARVSASRAATQAAHEGLHVHGGMGVTWESDCHLFVRRARQQAVLLGHEQQWHEHLVAELVTRVEQPPAERAAQAAAGNGSSMDFDDSPEEAAFRAECRSWLAAHAQPRLADGAPSRGGADMVQRMQAARHWQALKAASGFAAITWPRSLGGRGGTPAQELIWREEEARFDVPTGVFNVSLGMVMPTLLAHASAELLSAHVAPALEGRHLWCQLLSEPGAGSDLGMVRTRAQRCSDGREGWMLSGQKVWTSLAQFAEFGLVLARTDPTLPKFDGLSCFFIDMKSPGVTVRPIRQASGESEFNEVFLDEVFVPDTQRVGALGAGWKVTLTGLMSERMAIGGVLPAELWRSVALALRDTPFQEAPALLDGRFRERLGDLYLGAQGLWLLQCRALTALGKGHPPGPETSGAKILATRTLEAATRLLIDLQGPRGVLAAADPGEPAAFVERLWWGAAAMRIAGGTDEIVKNSIGERVLGLPPEPRSDKGVPFDQLPP